MNSANLLKIQNRINEIENGLLRLIPKEMIEKIKSEINNSEL